MLFRITATRADNGWSVELTNEANEPLRAQPGAAPPPPRLLGRRPSGGAYAFPLPPADDPPAPGSPEARLLAEDGGLSACFALIARQTPGAGDVERFGRYLFHTLIGPGSWAAIKSAAGGQPIELALCWDAGERCLARLPWEMMARPKPEHPAGSVFLAADEPLVAITRRVPGRAVLPAQLQTPPRVLFVVGTDLGEQVIRSGAEYLGLLRALESNDLGLRHQLLAQASPERLKAAIAFFRPSILHFICHGGVYSDSGRPFLDLRSDDPAGGVKEVTTDDLFTLLADGPEVEAVVLNACYTASAGDYSAVGQVALPMAEALVAGDGARSVPIVVGMAGEIGDRACRLFTRRFYETLLSGGSIAQATAQGRRLGLTNPHGDEWLTSLDWALPTLFLPASAGEATLAVSDDPDERVRQRNAGRFRHGEYPVFCGREDHFDAYAALMGDDRLQRLSRSPS
ncbi:MAG TPA: CHAT domain-containing protein, partial [Chloroflexaceae bacterium]|nr:CHAT domain-containing protein [Chloroflexaceae bacterium]